MTETMSTPAVTTPAPDTGAAGQPAGSTERADLLETLRRHRFFLRHTVDGLTDSQAALRPTVSELTLARLVKHVACTERTWARFAVEGASAFDDVDWAEEWTVHPGQTLAGLLADYADVARRTDELVTSLPSLDLAHPLPAAPWFEPGASWSARRVLLHVVAETSQHAGHADIIRESIDGQKTMG